MENKIWFKEPAADWNEALPLGNGRLGAMVFGQLSKERIQLNEDSVWYGGPQNRDNPDALANLPAIRESASLKAGFGRRTGWRRPRSRELPAASAII